jgi:ATP-dependent Clp protease ATP-binding subunit ClpC
MRRCSRYAQIEGHTTIREKVSTSPSTAAVENECNGAGARQKRRSWLSHKHIRTEQLLGLSRGEVLCGGDSAGAWLRLPAIREELQRTTQEKAPSSQSSKGQRGEQSMLAEFWRDLTQFAMDQQLDPLVDAMRR